MQAHTPSSASQWHWGCCYYIAAPRGCFCHTHINWVFIVSLALSDHVHILYWRQLTNKKTCSKLCLCLYTLGHWVGWPFADCLSWQNAVQGISMSQNGRLGSGLWVFHLHRFCFCLFERVCVEVSFYLSSLCLQCGHKCGFFSLILFRRPVS